MFEQFFFILYGPFLRVWWGRFHLNTFCLRCNFISSNIRYKFFYWFLLRWKYSNLWGFFFYWWILKADEMKLIFYLQFVYGKIEFLIFKLIGNYVLLICYGFNCLWNPVKNMCLETWNSSELFFFVGLKFEFSLHKLSIPQPFTSPMIILSAKYS